jgi:hypothetical protein
MTTTKARVGYTAAGVLLTVFALYPTIKGTMREQRWGLLLSPEEVRATCGKPQDDDLFGLTYIDGDRRVELRFFGLNHRMFLNHVKWSSSKGAGDINQVTRTAISEYVKSGWLPSCLELAAQ